MREKNKILIVDDETVNIMSLARILKPYYDIIVAIDGNTAIETAKKHIPDIILLDIVMPVMDGFEVLTELKSCELTKDIPVIFITGLDSAENEEKGLFLGAVDYITKPFHDSIVKARVKTHLKLLDYIRTIEKLSMVDTLTDLPNRRAFNDQMFMEWSRAARNKTSVAILIIDVDNFKIYNDTYGHPQGDLVLQTISSVLKETSKRAADFTARWGGEEFIMLLPDTDLNGALTIAEQLRQNIEQVKIIVTSETIEHITVSIGVNSIIPSSGDTIEDFISAADRALYTAKNNGKNQVCSS